jgi:hypothetical protein
MHIKKQYMIKSMKKRERIKRHSPSLKDLKRRRANHMQKGGHHPSTIYTHAHLDQAVWPVAPKDLVFDLTIHKKQVCHMFPLPTPPHIRLLRVCGERSQDNALVGNHTQWATREYHLRNFDFFAKNLQNLRIDNRSRYLWLVTSIQLFYLLTAQGRWSYNSHINRS